MTDALARFIRTVRHKISEVRDRLARIIWPQREHEGEENGLVSLQIYSSRIYAHLILAPSG